MSIYEEDISCIGCVHISFQGMCMDPHTLIEIQLFSL